MKTTIQLLIAVAALAFTIPGASAADKCPTGKCSATKAAGRKVTLDGKTVIVADCKYTSGVRSVRMVKVR